MRRELPSTVIDGKIQYWSASSLTLGDPTSAEGCPRKWYYEKILGMRPPQTKAQGFGVELHAQNEAYLLTGANGLGSLAMRGKHMLPTPGRDLFVEHDIVIPVDTELVARDAEQEGRLEIAAKVRASATLAEAPLKLLGIPVVGYIDLHHGRCLNQGASDPSEAVDPPGTLEVCDWKTSSSAKYTKSPVEISRTVQMTTYGAWVLTQYPKATGVRLSHGIYYTAGSDAPRKVSLRVLPDAIQDQWRGVERVASSLVEAASIKNVGDVVANRSACGAFGGCHHRSYCTAGAESGLAKYFGAAGARRIAEAALKGTKMTTEQSTRPKAGVLAIGRKNVNTNISVTTETVGVMKQPTAMEIEQASRDLAREEAQAAFPELEAQWEELKAAGLGTPKLQGEFAMAIADLYGLTLESENRLPGTGELAVSGPFEDLKVLAELVEGAKELAEERRMAEVIKIVPDGVDQEPDQAPIVQAPIVQAPIVQAPIVQAPAPAPRKRGRPPKVKPQEQSHNVAPQVDATVTHLSDQQAEAVEAAQSLHNVVVRESERSRVLEDARSVTAAIVQDTDPVLQSVFFYIDCTPSCAFQSFHPKVDEILEALTIEAKLPHIAQAPNGHDLGFGKWKYALELALKVNELPPGHWVFRSSLTEVSQIVVDTMRSVVTKQGGVFVQ